SNATKPSNTAALSGIARRERYMDVPFFGHHCGRQWSRFTRKTGRSVVRADCCQGVGRPVEGQSSMKREARAIEDTYGFWPQAAKCRKSVLPHPLPSFTIHIESREHIERELLTVSPFAI